MLEKDTLAIIRDVHTGVLTGPQAVRKLHALIGTVVAVTSLRREQDLFDTYDTLRALDAQELCWCNTCGWNKTEPHPTRPKFLRCANCKSYRIRLGEAWETGWDWETGY